MEAEELDVTVGPGKLLGLFFMLAAICGVFFAIGYSLGKTSAHEQALNDKAPLSASLNAPAVIGDSSAPKPSAVVSSKAEAAPEAAQEQKQESPAAPDLTFFNAVKKDDHSGKKPEASSAAKPTETVSTTPPATQEPGPTTAKAQPKTEITTTVNGAFVVQIAAVTREEDAAALAGALRKKSYSVFVVNNPATHDKFYHVQVGPFATLQDAEAMKAKLTSEGYNPIVKKSA
jgi:cell division septation protein DedD